MIVHLESKHGIVSHPVTSKQPNFAVQIRMGHPVEPVIIHKSRSEVSVVEQDTIEYVSTAYFEPKKRKKKEDKSNFFYKRDIMQVFSADATIFKKYIYIYP
jgi:hypothetical protein